MLGPGPGPAPTPSLTLPPLRELDKALGPEADHGRISNPQPRSQSSDPHLHQHFQQQRPQQQHGQGHGQYSQHSPSLASSQHSYKHHDSSSRFSSTGSLPDLYMSSPAAPPSTTTSSSPSRTDSISNMDYLQSNSTSRTLPGATGGGTVPNSSETETANPQQHQEPAPSSSTPAAAPNNNTTTTATTTTASTVATTGAAAKEGNAKNNATTAENQQQQGRNSTKRAAQNRAAQRAFRQRKDLYVRELERKADLLQQAEFKIARLSARNRELEELVFQAQQYRQGISPSPMVSPLPHHLPHAHNQDSPITGGSLDRGDRERGRESDREWEREREREWAIRERSHNHADSIGGPPYDHFNPSSIPRPALGRHSSHQHLRHAYNASSPPISSDAFKHLSLNNKLSSRLHDQQRPESDHEIEMRTRPSRHLHRHPSESSLNLSRAGSFPGAPAPTDSRIELGSSSPVVNSANNAAMGTKASTPGSLGALPPSGPHDLSSLHHYPSSPLTPTHERIPPYSSNQNPRGISGMAGPNGPMSSPTSEVSSYDFAKKRPSDGTIGWSGSSSGPGSDLYRSSQDAHPHHPYLAHHAVKKQASWSSLSDQRRLQHSLKKQPSWGSISEYRHSWRTKSVESPEMVSENARFGGGGAGGGGGGGGAVPGLPRIPSQFSQRPPPPPALHHHPHHHHQQQQHSSSGFEREHPPSPAASFTYSPTSAHSQPYPQHGRQPSDYFNTPRAPAAPATKHDRHESSDMEIVQDSSHSSAGGGHYAARQQAVYDADPYEMERDDRFVRKESIKSNMSVVSGSSPERSYNMQSDAC
ncbi:hypothetical protein EC968_005885 [Mortierella alpina]|nr:hypothetical protein EC968_005885 [Mortierella alpina]